MPSRVLTAEFVAVGSELTVGETRDTNSAELAASLTAEGVRIVRLTAVPDDLETVRDVFVAALRRADLIVSTGGLGPTPDDLTREALAAATGEVPSVDPELEVWLRGLWERRGVPFPTLNLKQAWLIPGATPLENPNGTAPGWWIDRPDGRVVIALPGPPREMRPMWHDHALPRLRERGLGRPMSVRTLRLAGIGESQLADLLGEPLLRAPNPVVATYARADAVDIRISALAPAADLDPERALTAAEAITAATEQAIAGIVGQYIWARGATTWAEAIGQILAAREWRMAVAEHGTGGSFASLLGDVEWLVLGERRAEPIRGMTELERDAERVGELSGAEVGVAVSARPRNRDTAVSVAVVTPIGTHRERRIAFLGGAQGRLRAALAAADVIHAAIGGRVATPGGSVSGGKRGGARPGRR